MSQHIVSGMFSGALTAHPIQKAGEEEGGLECHNPLWAHSLSDPTKSISTKVPLKGSATSYGRCAILGAKSLTRALEVGEMEHPWSPTPRFYSSLMSWANRAALQLFRIDQKVWFADPSIKTSDGSAQALAARPDGLTAIHEPTWWKERTSVYMLSSDWHTNPIACPSR